MSFNTKGISQFVCPMALIILMSVLCTPSFAETIRVHQYQSIQDAISAAQDGDIIEVEAGTFRENIVLKNGITLIGSGADRTIIDGGQNGPVVIAPAKTRNSTIQGFTITNGEGEGVLCKSGASVAIKDNTISNCTSHGICFYGGRATSEISSNHIFNNGGHGIAIANASPAITDNHIYENECSGIHSWNPSAAPTISHNEVFRNGDGITYLNQSRPEITNNQIYENLYVGIGDLHASSYRHFPENTVIANGQNFYCSTGEKTSGTETFRLQ